MRQLFERFVTARCVKDGVSFKMPQGDNLLQCDFEIGKQLPRFEISAGFIRHFPAMDMVWKSRKRLLGMQV
jgi:hypothetical protein